LQPKPASGTSVDPLDEPVDPLELPPGEPELDPELDPLELDDPLELPEPLELPLPPGEVVWPPQPAASAKRASAIEAGTNVLWLMPGTHRTLRAG
jgi:hypothetical protein